MSNQRDRDSAARLCSRLFLVEFTFFWSAKTEKGYQRIAMSCEKEIPFVPVVGMHIDIGGELPAPKLTEVVYKIEDDVFSCGGDVELFDWDSQLFESLMDGIRKQGADYSPELYDDNWLHK